MYNYTCKSCKLNSFDSLVMSLLVGEYRKAVINHAPIAKRQEAYQVARNWHLARKACREELARQAAEGEDPWLI